MAPGGAFSANFQKQFVPVSLKNKFNVNLVETFRKTDRKLNLDQLLGYSGSKRAWKYLLRGP